jgi:hypothetical protein
VAYIDYNSPKWNLWIVIQKFLDKDFAKLSLAYKLFLRILEPEKP